jgi:glutamine amidotransferase
MISIVDYGLGNVKAFFNVYHRLGITCSIASKKEDFDHTSHIILPGVGAFDHAMRQLELSGMKEALNELVVNKRTPVLGVCVGMQMMGLNSEEGVEKGLGWINVGVKKLKAQINNAPFSLPHMGWNEVSVDGDNPLFRQIDQPASFYFLHSFYVDAYNTKAKIGITSYGFQFASAVQAGNVFGVQFHPEKSHKNGIKLLENFSKV